MYTYGIYTKNYDPLIAEKSNQNDDPTVGFLLSVKCRNSMVSFSISNSSWGVKGLPSGLTQA